MTTMTEGLDIVWSNKRCSVIVPVRLRDSMLSACLPERRKLRGQNLVYAVHPSEGQQDHFLIEFGYGFLSTVNGHDNAAVELRTSKILRSMVTSMDVKKMAQITLSDWLKRDANRELLSKPDENIERIKSAWERNVKRALQTRVNLNRVLINMD